MKILYLDHTAQIGGGELSLLSWLKHEPATARVLLFEDGPYRALLESSDIAVDIFSSSEPIAIRRGSGLSALVRAVPSIVRFRARLRTRTAGFDVLYANSQKAFFMSALALRRRQKLVWHLRDILTAEHFSRSLRRLAVFTANRFATVVIANSQSTADSFVAAGGDPTKVKVVYPGIDPTPFDSVSEVGVRALSEDLWPSADLTAGIFGRITEWKGQLILLEAISALPRFQAVIIGDALFGEQAYKDVLIERASRADLKGRVHFLGFRKDIPTLMRAIDIAVHASVAPEPFGRVIVEGMLARKPVIATRAGGAAEIIRDQIDGILVTPGSVSEMHSALERLQTDPALRMRMAQAGRQRAEASYSAEALIRNTATVLKSLRATRSVNRRDARGK